MGCINKNLKDNQRLIQDFSETRVNQLFDEYFPKENPSYSEFISNPNVKEALGIIPISKVKSEIGKAFGKEISSRELKILKNEEPNYALARVALGIIHYGNGDVLEAQSEWEKVLLKDPFNQEAAMYLNLSKTATETTLK